MGQMLSSDGFKGMMKIVLDFLIAGNELDAGYAARTWNELNVRNKISVLKSKGWHILDEYRGDDSFKTYWLDMTDPKADV